jgi:hypothetical protein
MSDIHAGGAVATPGHSGKALWQKLGLKPGLRVWLRHAPTDFSTPCGFEPASVLLAASAARQVDFGHVSASSRTGLASDLPLAARKLASGGMLWISWPKKSSGVTSDVDEGTLRDIALPLGRVDVKVCAVTAIWSGLKFVRRRSRRPGGG